MDITNDFNNFLTYNEILDKYKHLGLTKGKLETFIRQNNLKRNKPSFTNRFNISNINTNISLSNNLQNTNMNTHIPIEKSYKVEKVVKEGSTITLKDNDTILYDNRIIKQKLPKKPVVDVVKTKSKSKPKIDKYDDIMQNAMSILNNTKKTLSNKEIM